MHPGPQVVIRGIVVHGDKRGRALGFPTANIALGPDQVPPADGIYCGLVKFAHHDSPNGATISVGTNPTFPDVKSTRVEAHIHDLDEILYGLTAELILVSRLRDMQRFASIDELIAQTQLDVWKSRQLLTELGLIPLPPAD